MFVYGHKPHDPWGCCPRCGDEVRLSQFRQEWTGLRVCRSCWDPRPETLTPPSIYPEGQVRRDAQPLPDPVFIDPDEPFTPEDL